MTAIQNPVAATYLDKTRIVYDVVAADYADLLRGPRLVRAAEQKEKQPRAYAPGVKPG